MVAQNVMVTPLLLLAVGLAVSQLQVCSCVVVDGNKQEELSPMRNQTKDEESAIDSFNTKTCGMADPDYQEHEFINMARDGQFPWMVSFQIKILDNLSYGKQVALSKKSLNETTEPPVKAQLVEASGIKKRRRREDLHFCSGSFISDRWILSAAHCFSDDTLKNYLRNDKLIAVAGSTRVSSRSSLNRNLTIERIYVHSKFNPVAPIGYDIALVELRNDSRADFSQRRPTDDYEEQQAPFINSICLPLQDKRYQFNESARIAGWGLSQAKDVRTMPSKLLTTDLLLTQPAECLKHYKKVLNGHGGGAGGSDDKTSDGEPAPPSDDLLCAGFKTTRDACQSDSGGPLMQYANKKAVAIGIVSFGKGCATRGVPGLYTRTSAYTNWIKEITTKGRKAEVEFEVLESPPASSNGSQEASDDNQSDGDDGDRVNEDVHDEDGREDEDDAEEKEDEHENDDDDDDDDG